MSEEKQLDPKRGLVAKLCEIMAAVGYLQKKGWNAKQEYKYLREADVVEKMRDEFASRNIFIFPSLVHHENVKLSKIEYDKIKEVYQTNVVMRWTIVDGDTMQERVCEIPGSSASPGDKGVYVAMTGSEKYLLMKSFLLPTGDDPEDDANEERGSKEAAQALGQQKIADLKAKKPNGNGHQEQSLEPLLQASIDAQKAKKLNLPPIPAGAPKELLTPIDDDDFDEMSGTIQEIRDLQTSAAKGAKRYKKIAITTFQNGELIDREISSFDNFVMSDGKAWDFLDAKKASGLTATLIVQRVEKEGKTYWNLKDLKQIGDRKWDERIGIHTAAHA